MAYNRKNNSAQTTSNSDISELPTEEQRKSAFAKLLRSVSSYEQSSLRIRRKLEIAGYSNDAIEYSIDKAIRIGAIDDNRYAECLVRSAALSGKGMELIKREVSELGIRIEDIESYQEYMQNGEEAQIECALNLLERHPSRAKDKKAAAMRKLLAKGYSMDIATKAASRWLEDNQNKV